MLDKSGARVKRTEGRAGAACVRLLAIIRVDLPASVRGYNRGRSALQRGELQIALFSTTSLKCIRVRRGLRIRNPDVRCAFAASRGKKISHRGPPICRNELRICIIALMSSDAFTS